MNCKNCGAPLPNEGNNCEYCLSQFLRPNEEIREIRTGIDQTLRATFIAPKSVDVHEIFGMKGSAVTAHTLRQQDPARYAALRVNAKKAGLI